MAKHLGICGSYDSFSEFIYTSKSKRRHSAIGWTSYMLVCFFLKGLDFTSVKCQYRCTCSRQINVLGPSGLGVHLWVSELWLNIR